MPTIVVSDLQPPPDHPLVHSYERGLDPWHRDAFPPEFRDRIPLKGPRGSGWFHLDAWGNEIGFTPDGVVIELDTFLT